jgi:hypothetical protein
VARVFFLVVDLTVPCINHRRWADKGKGKYDVG